MVTGDHPATALAIARPLGIAESPDDVVTGAEFADAAADEARLRDLVAGRRVFARIEPLQKLRIVQALQEAGHFVAVTGDGVNDAPALSAAHIGVAMGRSGTDAARQAADLILADDNFASVVAGVFEGRVAYANIRKVIAFLLGTSTAEVLLFFLCAIAGLPLPLFALQLLWLNLVTDTIQHVALALEGPEADVMKRGPRRPDESLFDRRMIEEVALAGGVMALVRSLFFGALLAHGRSVDEARNLLLLLMVSFENAHVLNCRSERASILRTGLGGNRWIPVVILLTQAVHVSSFFVPGLRDVLGVAPVSVGEWLGILGLAALLVVAMELYKRWRR